MENYIQVKKDKNILEYGIKDSQGNDTGERLIFDFEGTDLLLKLNKSEIQHTKNVQYLKNQFYIINKKEDHKGKYLLSSNEELKIEAMNEYYKREMEAMDLFLGKNGTRKILNAMGREPYWTMYEDISELIEPILPKFKESIEGIDKKIVEKYKLDNGEDNVIE